jgi:hypothetical protein
MEGSASYISTYQCQLVYGLFQTADYARAVLGVEQKEKLDEMVAARKERQRVLEREQPPVVWAVLDESALYRQIGSRDMMGSFTLLRFDDDPDIHYSESYDQGHMTANPQVIRERSVGYARLQADALSERDSAALIARVMEERYGEQPGHGACSVA